MSTTYSGSIDRDGLPYVSKVSFVPNLDVSLLLEPRAVCMELNFLDRSSKLASLEILSLTPTERTPEGMVIGSTFRYDHMQNGDIIGVSLISLLCSPCELISDLSTFCLDFR